MLTEDDVAELKAIVEQLRVGLPELLKDAWKQGYAAGQMAIKDGVTIRELMPGPKGGISESIEIWVPTGARVVRNALGRIESIEYPQ